MKSTTCIMFKYVLQFSQNSTKTRVNEYLVIRFPNHSSVASTKIG